MTFLLPDISPLVVSLESGRISVAPSGTGLAEMESRLPMGTCSRTSGSAVVKGGSAENGGIAGYSRQYHEPKFKGQGEMSLSTEGWATRNRKL